MFNTMQISKSQDSMLKQPTEFVQLFVNVMCLNVRASYRKFQNAIAINFDQHFSTYDRDM